MKILGIDGALGPFSAAVLDTNPDATQDAAQPALARVAVTDGGAALERGMWAIEDVLGPEGLAGVERIAVGTGPGSFTGLRIALSYAKSLALGAGLPLVGIVSYDALEPADIPLPALTVVHGRSGIGCVRLRVGESTLQRCGTYDDLAAWVATQLPGGGELSCAGYAEGVASHLGERGFIVRAYSPTIEPAALAIASLAAARDPAPSPHMVSAEYGELPAAVVRAQQDAG